VDAERWIRGGMCGDRARCNFGGVHGDGVAISTAMANSRRGEE
jgi:hypothetical protein